VINTFSTSSKLKSVTRNIIYTLSVLGLILIYQGAFCQLKNFNIESSRWANGTIHLINGQTITGELNYNFITGILKYREKDSEIPYTANKVLYFLLSDTSNYFQQKFYSLPYTAEGTTSNAFVFYEVIYENSTAAILSRHEFKYKEKTYGIGFSSNSPLEYGLVVNTGNEKIKERLYLINNAGQLLEYAIGLKDKTTYLAGLKNSKLNANDDGNSHVSRTQRNSLLKYRIVDKDAISKITEGKFKEVKTYYRKNKINRKTIAGLTEILEFYSSIDMN
jgi:hypothetical protein